VKIGYARVSTKDQNEERQIKKMLELGIEDRYIFIDKMSGVDFERPNYNLMKKIIRKGDLIYIDELSRLGRDYDKVISEWKHITREIEADIIILENTALFDSRKFKEMGDLGKLMEDQFLSLLAFVADQERKRIKRRQKEGIDIAKANGIKLGRPAVELPSNFESIYREWKKEEITAVEAARQLKLTKSTFYRRVNEYEKENEFV
jgi:DNA invertase Pin-like site-specific DNA recombinase